MKKKLNGPSDVRISEHFSIIELLENFEDKRVMEMSLKSKC